MRWILMMMAVIAGLLRTVLAGENTDSALAAVPHDATFTVTVGRWSQMRPAWEKTALHHLAASADMKDFIKPIQASVDRELGRMATVARVRPEQLSKMLSGPFVLTVLPAPKKQKGQEEDLATLMVLGHGTPDDARALMAAITACVPTDYVRKVLRDPWGVLGERSLPVYQRDRRAEWHAELHVYHRDRVVLELFGRCDKAETGAEQPDPDFPHILG